MELTRDCADPAAMQALGRELGERLRAGGVVALDGELGAGKTELVKGLAAELGFQGVVTSPTFTLLHEYRTGRQPLFHFDFYRVKRAEEILDLGWDEFLEEAGGTLAVEWASRFPELFPPETIWLRLEIPPEGGRRVLLSSLSGSDPS